MSRHIEVTNSPSDKPLCYPGNWRALRLKALNTVLEASLANSRVSPANSAALAGSSPVSKSLSYLMTLKQSVIDGGLATHGERIWALFQTGVECQMQDNRQSPHPGSNTLGSIHSCRCCLQRCEVAGCGISR